MIRMSQDDIRDLARIVRKHENKYDFMEALADYIRDHKDRELYFGRAAFLRQCGMEKRQ